MTDEVTSTALTIDLDDIDWEQLEEIEALAGHPIAREFETGELSFRTIRAFVLWKLRQSPGNAGMTFDTMPGLRSLAVDIGHKTPAQGKPDPLAQPRRAGLRARGKTKA